MKFININVGGHDAYKQSGVPIVADAREALVALTQAAEGVGIQPDTAYTSEIERLNQEWAEQLSAAVSEETPGEAMSQGKLIQVVNDGGPTRRHDCRCRRDAARGLAQDVGCHRRSEVPS